MAITTDLVDLHTIETTPTSGEATGYAVGGTPSVDTDYPVQGTQHLSATMTKTGLASIMVDNGAGITWTSGWSFLVWGTWLPAAACDTDTNGGLRVLVGSDLSNFRVWYVGGRDFGRYPYGGWQNFAVDPEETPAATVGTPGTTYRWAGFAVSVATAVARGNPLGLDAVRYGRCEIRVNGTETFASMATTNDASAARWGLFQEEAGSYRWKGLMTLGYSSTVSFTDSNKNIVIDNTRRVKAAFNRIEVRQSGSSVSWTGINIQALGTVSKGQFEAIDNATITLTGCSFTDMDTFVFQSNSTIIGTVFRRCGQITQGSATFNGGSLVTNSTAAVALLANNIDNVSDTEFRSSGTGHAIELTAAHAAGSYTLTNVDFTGYAGTDGSTGNEAIYNNSGGAVTINISGGNTPSIRNGTGATTTIVAGSVTVTLTVTNVAGTAIQDATVLIYATAGGPFPSADTVTIANSGTTATVTHTAHGLATNDKVLIKGASHAQNRGVFSITVTGVDTYTYTMGSAPGSNPTGTITSTFVLLSGLTSALGQLSMSRVFSSDQPIAGWARKSSGSPYYKTGQVASTVDSGLGANLTALLIADE
jgi:hypothetical protein